MLAGCGETQTRTKVETHNVTKTTKTHTPTANGGWVEKTVVVQHGTEDSDSLTKTKLDAEAEAFIGPIAATAGATIGAGTGTPEVPWGQIISMLVTNAGVGWAALKHGQARQLEQERDFHKTDADQAYKKLGVG